MSLFRYLVFRERRTYRVDDHRKQMIYRRITELQRDAEAKAADVDRDDSAT